MSASVCLSLSACLRRESLASSETIIDRLRPSSRHPTRWIYLLTEWRSEWTNDKWRQSVWQCLPFRRSFQFPAYTFDCTSVGCCAPWSVCIPPFFCMPPCVILWSTRESYKIIFAHCTPERCWSSSVGPQPPQTPHDGLYLVQLNIDHCSVTMQTNGPSTSHWKHSPVNSKQALKPNTTHDSPSFCPKITPLVVLPFVHANLHRPLT